MNNIRSTLATVWRIAAPYFRSEDKLAGRLLLAAVISIELSLVLINVLLNQWNNRFYNALQEKNWDGFVSEIGIFSILAACYIVARRLPALSQPVASDPLAPLDDHDLSRQMASRCQPLSDAAPGRCRRQPGPAHHRRRQMFVEQTLNIGVGLLSAMVTLVSFVVILWGLSAAAPLHVFGREFDDTRLSGVGRADLCHLRNGADAVDRLAVGQPRFPAAALRGRFSLQPGAGARKLRTDCAVAGREAPNGSGSRSASAASSKTGMRIMRRTKRLTAFTSSYSQAAVIFPYILVAPAYFADKIQLGGMMQTASAFSSVQKALSFFVSTYRTLAEWRAVVARLDGFEMAIAGAAHADQRSADSIDVVPSTGSDEDRSGAASRQIAQRNAAGLGRRASASAPMSAHWSPVRPAPANRPCSAPSPASGRSGAARSRSRRTPR